MKPHFLAASLGLCILWGCGAGQNGGDAKTPLIQTPAAQIHTPNFKETSSLRMVEGGQQLKVGDDVGEGELPLFPRPEKRAVAFRDLPPGFGPEYQSKGWETDAEGFGIISLNGRLVVAVRTELGVDESRVAQILRKYRIALDTRFSDALDIDKPDPQISFARYWFVDDVPHRLMICAVRMKTGVINITEAIGFDEAMDALRMGKDQAKHDLERVITTSATENQK